MSWIILATAIGLALTVFVVVPELLIRLGERRRRDFDPR
jgi:hypothetical protein